MKVQFSNVFALCSFLFMISCGPEDNPSGGDPDNGTFDPIEEVKPIESKVTLNGKSYDIKSAAYYHNSDRKGFDFVFSDTEIDFTSDITESPSGFILALDVPETAFGFTKELPFVIEGDDWAFYYGYSVDGVDALVEESPLIVASSIKSGSMNISLKDGVLELNFVSVDNKGDKLECTYQGKPYKSDHYIWWN